MAQHRLHLTLAAALLGVAACQTPQDASVSADLQRDLEQASARTIELAPRAERSQVVSAIEQTPSGGAPARAAAAPRRAPAVTVSRRTAAPRRAQAPEAPAVSELPAVAESPAPVPVPAAAEVPASSPAPARPAVGAARPTAPGPGPAAEPRGGYKTVGEIIRNAPFPIKP